MDMFLPLKQLELILYQISEPCKKTKTSELTFAIRLTKGCGLLAELATYDTDSGKICED